MPIMGPAELGAAVGQDPVDAQALRIQERDHPVVQDVGRSQRRLARVELGETDLGIGVDHRLLVDAADALQRADIEGVLRQAVSPDARR